MDQRGASVHTVHAYRDSWRLFLRFVAKRRQRAIADLTLSDLAGTEVIAFLDHLENERRCSVRTRNCRLAAVHSFFSFVADREPLAIGQCADVLRVPMKRAPSRTINYLEPEEVAAILAQPDCATPSGLRDHALLALLYNTGARIAEVLQLTTKATRLDPPSQVLLMGKGRKERICPLWPETASLLAALLKRQPRSESEAIFANRYGEPLTASGVRFRLREYVVAASKIHPRLQDKRVTPHTFRHTAAVHLVASGVDLTVIQSWLGHSHLDTTLLYAEANVETKRRALEQVNDEARPARAPRWKRDTSLLAWLDSL